MPLWIQSILFLISELFVDIITSLQGSDWEVIQVSEVHELLTKIQDIMDNAVCKQAGNTPFLFNSVSRQHYDVWALQFPFLYNFKNTVPPSEASLYGHINWPLAQVQ